jgi:dTDP-4-dehydrorhamnose 3,5-epimerase
VRYRRTKHVEVAEVAVERPRNTVLKPPSPIVIQTYHRLTLAGRPPHAIVGTAVSHGPIAHPRAQEACLSRSVDSGVKGIEALLQKRSAVRASGAPSAEPIAGLGVRAVRPVAHEDGYLAEIARADWPEIDRPIVQVHLTTTLPGRVRAWGLHQRSTDRLFVVSGLVKIAVFDGREASPTHGRINELIVDEHNPMLVVIPPDLYHGWKNIGTGDSIVINMPTALYDYERPDALDLPWDSPKAREIIPYSW